MYQRQKKSLIEQGTSVEVLYENTWMMTDSSQEFQKEEMQMQRVFTVGWVKEVKMVYGGYGHGKIQPITRQYFHLHGL